MEQSPPAAATEYQRLLELSQKEDFAEYEKLDVLYLSGHDPGELAWHARRTRGSDARSLLLLLFMFSFFPSPLL